MITLPYTRKWVKRKLEKYITNLPITGKSYKVVRREVQNLLSNWFYKWPINRVMVYKYKWDDGSKYWKIIVRLFNQEIHLYKYPNSGCLIRD